MYEKFKFIINFLNQYNQSWKEIQGVPYVRCSKCDSNSDNYSQKFFTGGEFECLSCGKKGLWNDFQSKVYAVHFPENQELDKHDDGNDVEGSEEDLEEKDETNPDLKYVLLHPALDFGGKNKNVLLLGFRKKYYNKKKRESTHKNIFVFATQGNNGEIIVTNLTGKYAHVYDDSNFVFDLDVEHKTRVLPNIHDKWSEELFSTAGKRIDAVDTAEVYANIFSQIKKCIDLANEVDYHITTAWIILTWFFPLFKAIPYLHGKGMKGSGKSSYLELCRLLCFNGFKERSTMASFRDNVDAQRGTALVDQADTKFGTQSIDPSLIVMVDSYKASGGADSKMVIVNKKQVRVEYDAFCPKAFASTKELHYDLRDRCFQIQFIKSVVNKEQVDGDSPIWLELRDSLYLLLISKFVDIQKIISDVNEKYRTDTDIVSRDAELWKPIEVILKFCQQDESTITFVRNSYKSKISLTKDTISPMEARLVKYVGDAIGDEKEIWISVKSMVSHLTLAMKEEEDEEWEEMKLKNRSKLVGNLISRLNLHIRKKHSNDGNLYLFEKERLSKILLAYTEKPESSDSPGFTAIKHIDNKDGF